MAEVDAKILKQVEFYFSNSNLPGDKFLRGLTQKEDGWVDISVISSFKMMKKLSEDQVVIVAAIRKSPELLEVNEEGTKLRRKIPLPENVDITPSSIYAKGFPEDYTLAQINEFFGKVLEEKEKILSTRLRRFKDKKFKGSVFIEFDSVATAQRVAGLTLKAPTEEAADLLVKMKGDYLSEKKEEMLARKNSKKRKNTDAAEDSKEPEVAFKRDVVLDSIIKIENLPEGCMREDIKSYFEGADCAVAFVEFNKGNELGYVRLGEESEIKAAATAAKLTEAKTELEGKIPALTVLTGDDEQAYWTKTFDLQEAKKKGRSNNKKGKGGGYRGGKRQRK